MARDGGAGFDANRFAERLEKRDEDLRSRLETLFDAVDNRLQRIEKDAARGAQERHSLANELAEVRTLLGEGREATALLGSRLEEHITATTTIAAAATVVAVRAEETSETLLQRLAGAMTLQKGTFGVGALAAVAWVISEGPSVVRFLNAWGRSVATFWEGLSK